MVIRFSKGAWSSALHLKWKPRLKRCKLSKNSSQHWSRNWRRSIRLSCVKRRSLRINAIKHIYAASQLSRMRHLKCLTLRSTISIKACVNLATTAATFSISSSSFREVLLCSIPMCSRRPWQLLRLRHEQWAEIRRQLFHLWVQSALRTTRARTHTTGMSLTATLTKVWARCLICKMSRALANEREFKQKIVLLN